METFLVGKGEQFNIGAKNWDCFPLWGTKCFFYHRGGTSFPILVFLMGSVSKCQSRRSSLNQLVMFVKRVFLGHSGWP